MAGRQVDGWQAAGWHTVGWLAGSGWVAGWHGMGVVVAGCLAALLAT
ncbi:MAG: hypothetical protein GY938_08810 [Ketobacter sp.]|nr:hypothetical protein [Ketobacter sp.]